ncbi:hypothetical protein R6Q59_012408 [Mikania micrantha]
MGPITLALHSNNSSMSPSGKASQFSSSFKPSLIYTEGFIAGGTAGVVETALYPIDTIKTRLQAVRGGGKIVLQGLYSGLAGNLVGVLPASALFVGVYEPAKKKLLKTFPENFSAVAHLTAGAIGGVAASLVRVPTEVVKQRMQTGQFASAPDAVRLIVSKEGFKGLYAGYGSFLLRDLPFDAIQFCIYEQLRLGYKLAARRDLNDPENAAIGAFSGSALTGAITTPLDVIKTRLMVQGSANQYKGIFNCVQTILKEEGPSALLKLQVKNLTLLEGRMQLSPQTCRPFHLKIKDSTIKLKGLRKVRCKQTSPLSLRKEMLLTKRPHVHKQTDSETDTNRYNHINHSHWEILWHNKLLLLFLTFALF